MKRFKIDFYDGSTYRHFGLYYYIKRSLFGWQWKLIDAFETAEEARKVYEKIKDLPEYLP